MPSDRASHAPGRGDGSSNVPSTDRNTRYDVEASLGLPAVSTAWMVNACAPSVSVGIGAPSATGPSHTATPEPPGSSAQANAAGVCCPSTNGVPVSGARMTIVGAVVSIGPPPRSSRAIRFAFDSANQGAPSDPSVMPCGAAPAASGYSVIWPPVVIFATLAVAVSVNHMAPWGPATMCEGCAPTDGIGKAASRSPKLVTRPMLFDPLRL